MLSGPFIGRVAAGIRTAKDCSKRSARIAVLIRGVEINPYTGPSLCIRSTNEETL